MADARPSSPGRYIVATSVLTEGTVVLQECAMVKQLGLQHQSRHCSECFKRLDRVTPRICRRAHHCQWQIRFCSSSCEMKHWATGHRWLCRFPEFAALSDEALLAIRIFFRMQGNDAMGKGVSNLVSNLESHTLAQREVYEDSVRLFIQTFYLPPPTVQVLVVLLAQIRCNAFAIQQPTAESVSQSPIEPLQMRHANALGIGIYQSASRFNHACHPNAVALFPNPGGGDSLEIRTTHVIQAGEPITISYGPLAAKHDTHHRQNFLKEHYFFICECDACSPTHTSKASPERIYQCQHCTTGHMIKHETICPDCETPMDWVRVAKLEDHVERLWQQNKLEESLACQLAMYHRCALPIGRTLDRLAQAEAMACRFDVSADYCQQSLAIVQHTFGRCSVEAAEEMMKLATLLFNSHDHRRALAHIKATRALYCTLGLDQQRPSDMDDLRTMVAHLDNSP